MEALLKMGPRAAGALPALQEFAQRNPQWADHVNLAIKAIAPDELSGVGVMTPLPPLDAEAAGVARQIEEGTMSISQLAAVVENPKTALVAARALAEFGPAASEALPALRRAFDAAVQTDLSTAFVLGAAIERLDPRLAQAAAFRDGVSARPASRPGGGGPSESRGLEPRAANIAEPFTDNDGLHASGCAGDCRRLGRDYASL
jgi:hypothetical protein